MYMDKEKLAELCDARNKLCAYCEVDECAKCIVTRLIDDAMYEYEEATGTIE